MIRKLKYAILSDIGTFDLIYYEEEKEAELIKLCTNNGITYLPDKSREFAYKLDNGKFEKTEINDQLKVNPYDLIFDKKTIKKFKEVDHNEIRFIMENGLIKGVVHIVDYNSDYIGIELFKALLKFEKNIRQLLINNKLTNDDFIEWVIKRAEKDDFWKRRLNEFIPSSEEARLKNENKRKNRGPFQTFNLRELIEFASSKKLINGKEFPTTELSKIRNHLAHNKDVTSKIDDSNETAVYHFEGLESFVKQMNVFFKSFEVLEDTLRVFK